jgi:hypothetical protein
MPGAIPIVIPHHRAGYLILRRLGLVVVLMRMRKLRPMRLGHAVFEECDWFGHGFIYMDPALEQG